jgi:hypothetical protein
MASIDVIDGERQALFTLDGSIAKAIGATDWSVSLTVTEHGDIDRLRQRLRQAQRRAAHGTMVVAAAHAYDTCRRNCAATASRAPNKGNHRYAAPLNVAKSIARWGWRCCVVA